MRAAIVGLRDLIHGRFWPLLALSATGWVVLIAVERLPDFGSICGGSNLPLARALGVLASFRPIGASLALVFTNALMLCAMMAPLLHQPLMHVHARALAERRARATLLFLTAYFAVWLLALLAIAGVSAFLQAAMPEHQGALLTIMLGVALAWQGSGMRKQMLIRCCVRPALPVFGMAAELGSLRFGASTARWCVGSCWALMAIPFAAPHAHLLAMGAVAMIMLLQQYHHPLQRRVHADLVGLGVAAMVLGTASAIV